jgi:hypothetical protein
LGKIPVKPDTEKTLQAVAAVGVALIVVILLLLLGSSFVNRRAALRMATTELRDIRAGLGSFHREFGIYPTGTASGILEALMGKNTKERRFLILSSSSTPPFYDPWGEPYIVIPASGSRGPEFYSKGPDTIDDRCRSGSDDIRSGVP